MQQSVLQFGGVDSCDATAPEPTAPPARAWDTRHPMNTHACSKRSKFRYNLMLIRRLGRWRELHFWKQAAARMQRSEWAPNVYQDHRLWETGRGHTWVDGCYKATYTPARTATRLHLIPQNIQLHLDLSENMFLCCWKQWLMSFQTHQRDQNRPYREANVGLW